MTNNKVRSDFYRLSWTVKGMGDTWMDFKTEEELMFFVNEEAEMLEDSQLSNIRMSFVSWELPVSG